MFADRKSHIKTEGQTEQIKRQISPSLGGGGGFKICGKRDNSFDLLKCDQ